DWLLPPAVIALILGVTVVLKRLEILPPLNDRPLICGLSGILFLAIHRRPIRFGVGLLVLLLVSLWYPSQFGRVLYNGRSFFGTYRATEDLETNRRVLFQGNTVHGAQNAGREMRLRPSSYYHQTSPVGQVFGSIASSLVHGKFAVVGLGTGALACHGTAGQSITFYEIDPLVEKIARDDQLFTYLRDCPPKIDVVIGDARISLAKAADRSYDLFVLDAFSSDVIPVHLLTREAVELYLSKTTVNGVLLFHISNRYMDLAPVLDRLAKELRLTAFIQNDFKVTPEESSEGKSSSRWILMTRDQRTAKFFHSDPRWRLLNGQLGGDLWTDDYSDILKVLYW
ncbi:MAG TPA: fused MFS/spermidine synthase, partial [Acidobacteriota bacterium]|nr:fused MFS/spermidine synthase [Acidobacteriota bacterium]